jgi:hypothetical protein
VDCTRVDNLVRKLAAPASGCRDRRVHAAIPRRRAPNGASLPGNVAALLLDAAPVFVDLPLLRIQSPLRFVEHPHPLPGIGSFVINGSSVIASSWPTGPTLVLLLGLLLGLAALEALQQTADGILHVLRPDRRGTGRTEYNAKGDGGD